MRFAPLLAALLLLGGSSYAAVGPGALKQRVVRLPSTWPERVALTDDGSLWLTDEFVGIARVRPYGAVEEVTLSMDPASDGSASDIVKGSDGAVWFAASGTVGRVDPVGNEIKTWPVGGYGSAGAITAAHGVLWFTDEDFPGRIERLGANGDMKGFKLSGRRASFTMSGIASGPDGSLWFTQSGYGLGPPDSIGRMTIDGRYTSWRLPRRRAGPTRITAGPDDALWFTEEDAHAIGGSRRAV